MLHSLDAGFLLQSTERLAGFNESKLGPGVTELEWMVLICLSEASWLVTLKGLYGIQIFNHFSHCALTVESFFYFKP